MSEQLTQTIERLAALKTVPMFSELTAEELFLVSIYTDYITANYGELLIREGDEGGELYIIIKGAVDVYKNYKSVNEIKIAELKSGAVIGEMAVISNNKRSATIVIKEKTLLLSMNGLKFMELLPTNSSIALKLIHALADKINNTKLQDLL